MGVNFAQEIFIMARDAANPRSMWANVTTNGIPITGVLANTTLGYTQYFFVQNTDGSLIGYDIQWDGPTSSISTSGTVTLAKKGWPGTKFAVTQLAFPPSTIQNLTVFGQESSNDIVQNMKLQDGDWTFTELEMPTS